MEEELKIGCARPTGSPVGETVELEEVKPESFVKEVTAMIKVGKRRQILPHQGTTRVSLSR